MIPNSAFRLIASVCCALALVLCVSTSTGAVSPGVPDFDRAIASAREGHSEEADQQGRIEVSTIVPSSYPGGGFRHIHYVIRADGYEESMLEVILDENPRPSRQQKEWAVRNGDVVARRSPGKGGVSTLDVVLRIHRSGS